MGSLSKEDIRILREASAKRVIAHVPANLRHDKDLILHYIKGVRGLDLVIIREALEIVKRDYPDIPPPLN